MRKAEVCRKTGETDIRISLALEGDGTSTIDTGVGFLDHMLTLFARHGRFDLEVSCKGDTCGPQGRCPLRQYDPADGREPDPQRC